MERSIQKDKGARRFLQLNYVIHLLAGGVSVLLFWIYRVNYPLQLSGIVYLIVIIVVVLYYWKSPIPKWNLFSASIVFGFIVFYRTINVIVEITPLWPGIFTGILSAAAISIVMFLVVLSLNRSIREDSMHYLINLLFKYLILFIGIRMTWDLVVLFNISVETRNGELMSALRFFLQVDSFKLILLILFGLIIPVLFYPLFSKRLNVFDPKYRFFTFCVLLILIWSAEFLYKYFLLQYGIVL
jgi:TctA family transporter